MNKGKRWLLEIKIFSFIGIGLIICTGLIYLITRSTHLEEEAIEVGNLESLGNFDWIVMPVMKMEEDSTHVFINQTDITDLSREELYEAIEEELENQRKRIIQANYLDQSFEVTRGQLGLSLEGNIDEIIDEIIEFRREYILMEEIHQTRLPIIEQFNLNYQYDNEKIDGWIRSIRSVIDIPMVEPSLIKTSQGGFEPTPGSIGTEVKVNSLKRSIQASLTDGTNKTFELKIFMEEVTPTRDVTLLESIDSKISSFTSFFPTGNVGRVQNVKLATSLVNQTVLMPGDEFSYTEKVTPVTAEAGYKNATIFLNGRPVDGIGGGICQVSSTLYNAQLQAGIVATQRQNHSRIVDYVPRGQDATMAVGLIDYRFVNTLDYPIYIHAYTGGGSVTIELWSNEQALDGISYMPKTIFSGLTEDGRRRYDTTLFGYNSKGEQVFEQFLHRSSYITKN